ncbi:CPBP family intramembrane glutamic endopeptidase [Staphylococcus simulans]|uniref:CPBP family intramembrane glutamic endopeptidase n=1 Tax=Staphylococcus simulans TaxID=1286 RepID=UPI0021CFFE33|nr:type II CAAX endopeptidase family protein [Staphylococcus simulans]UXR45226.1 CPBP family intramembrane metalloprotease [Staphylococcus simulans]
MLKNIVKISSVFILLFVVSVIAQNVGILWHILDLWSFEGLFHGVTYVIVAWLLFKLIANKLLKKPLAYFRVTPFRFYISSSLLGVLLSILVVGIYLVFIPGQLILTKLENDQEYIAMIIEIVIIGGIAAPIVEEIMFRGILLKYIEAKTNIYIALLSTSILFGIVHLFNGQLKGISLVLLMVSITTAGIMYGLAVYLFNSVWASIIIHIIWNLSALITVTDQNIEYGVIQYIIKFTNPLITGGEYGIDASLISIAVYTVIIFILIAYRNFSKSLRK